MLLKISWRNIWRSPMRSLVVIVAIALGIWAAFFMSGFAIGMVRSYVENAVQHVTSHIQLHHPDFKEDFEPRFAIADAEKITSDIRAMSEVATLSSRAVANGMISSSQTSRGIQILGVEPNMEHATTRLKDELVDGTYFGGDRRNQILMGHKLAEKMKVKVRAKVVLTFQDVEGHITAGAFRVVGLFDTGNAPYDEGHVMVQRADLDRLLSPGQSELRENRSAEDNLMVHEMAVMLHDPEQVEVVKKELASRYPNLLVETYREISPDLRLYETQLGLITNIYMVIILLALVFGIINTMLMSVLERVRELGMLMAIGMNKGKVFGMIVLETVLLSMAGLPLGILLGHITVAYFAQYGLDLSMYSDSLKLYGLSEQVFFDVPPAIYWQYPVALAITAVLASIYPAFKAIRLKPVDAIRKI